MFTLYSKMIVHKFCILDYPWCLSQRLALSLYSTKIQHSRSVCEAFQNGFCIQLPTQTYIWGSWCL